LPDSYFEEFVPKLSLVNAGQVTEAARKYLDLERMTTVVVGDVDKIHASLDRLGMPITMLST
jgi:predicted Zn-dependent peptidase